jgi:hypothetical protein
MKAIANAVALHQSVTGNTTAFTFSVVRRTSSKILFSSRDTTTLLLSYKG